MEIFLILIILIIFAVILIIIESIIEMKKLKITEYNINHSKLPKEFRDFKIILISDMHNCFYNNEKIINCIKEHKPNCVIISGDMLVYGSNQMEDNIKSLKFIEEISLYSDVYYAPGNHEMGYMIKDINQWNEYEEILLNSPNDNIYYLDNKSLKLTRNDSSMWIYGLHLTDGYYKRFIKKKLDVDDINRVLGESKDNDFNILISHNPDYFKIYSKWGANVTLSGHNHGGLVRLPLLGGLISPRLRLFPKFDYGKFYNYEDVLILSGGLGAHSLKIRFNNKPELVIINLNS